MTSCTGGLVIGLGDGACGFWLFPQTDGNGKWTSADIHGNGPQVGLLALESATDPA
jgi:hypothetical protein